MFEIALLAVCLAAPGEKAYDVLPVVAREALTEAWKREIRDSERAIEQAEKDATEARLAIRRTPANKRRAAIENANKAKEHVEELGKQLEALKENKEPFVPDFHFVLYQPKVGRIGTIGEAVAFQKRSDDELYIDVIYRVPPQPGNPSGNERFPVLVKAPGVAKEAIDGQHIELPNLWQVSGTHTYTATDGSSRTIPLLERFEWPSEPHSVKE